MGLYKLRILLHILMVTIGIGLAISYLTILSPGLADLNVLEAIGVYCISLPVIEFIKSAFEDQQY